LAPLSGIVDAIAEAGHGLVMVMGKGGVGKTTIAAAIAVELAARGLPVHLTTTDPAAHLAEALGGEVPSLKVSRIDPAAETAAYRGKVLTQTGRNLDAAGLALLEEDLRSPCTEEVAVFHAFSRLVFGARREIVVMDTAPTGHTLLLLDATGAYHREVLRTATGAPGTVHTPLMRLRDPAYTRILVVTLPETTPVTEAAHLQADLRRAGIEPFAWVVNASLAAAGPTDPVLVERAVAELEQIEKVRFSLATRIAIVPWMAEEPRGSEALRRLAKLTTAILPLH
jgi:arsenite/tail-anchored protein-transporting ATPase